MNRVKEIKGLTITHVNGDVDEVKDGGLALGSFERHENMNVSEEKVVTFHAVDRVVVTKSTEEERFSDDSCQKSCVSMGSPIIEGDMDTINVKTKEEFDPTEEVKAYDDNGNEISVKVEEE